MVISLLACPDRITPLCSKGKSNFISGDADGATNGTTAMADNSKRNRGRRDMLCMALLPTVEALEAPGS